MFWMYVFAFVLATVLIAIRRASVCRKSAKTGYDACRDGVDVAYDEDEEEHRSWEDGWRAARKHDHDESEG